MRYYYIIVNEETGKISSDGLQLPIYFSKFKARLACKFGETVKKTPVENINRIVFWAKEV